MSQHEFTLKVTVDDEGVAKMYNPDTGVHGIVLDPDPSEWTDVDLANALREGVATFEITGYDARV